MLAELKTLAGEFLTRPLNCGREMRELLDHSPAEFCAAAVEFLGGNESDRVKRYLVALLWTNNLLLKCLTDPATPPERAESIAALARQVDPQLPAKLIAFVLDGGDGVPPERIERTLAILRSQPDTATLRPLLTPLLRHPNARIRSKVASLVGEGNRNRTWFERRMREEDPRVRANAIESACSSVAEDLRPVFRAARSDTNNRVVGNALISLYRLGEAEAIGDLHDLLLRPEPEFRATAMWAMGETGDARFLPLLARKLTDPNDTNKAAAFRAMKKLRGKEGVAARPLRIRILGEPTMRDSILKVVFDVSDQDRAVIGLPATAVCVSINGETVYHYSACEEDSRNRIAAAFLLRQPAGPQQVPRAIYREALEKCFRQRRPGDAWAIAHYSSRKGAGVSAETLFGVRMDHQETDGSQLITKLEELHAALNCPPSAASPDFSAAFVSMCQELRLARVKAHLFLVDPVGAAPLVAGNLIEAAQEAHVRVHSVCEAYQEALVEVSQSTRGFYVAGEPIPEILPALYRGLSHRYAATLTPQGPVRQVQVAVRSPDYSGESPIVELTTEAK